MRYKIIVLLAALVTFSCENEEEITLNDSNISNEWYVESLEYTSKYSDTTFIITENSPTTINGLVGLKTDGTYEKVDFNQILVLGLGKTGTTGLGTWGTHPKSDSIYFDRLEYYNFGSEIGNQYDYSISNNSNNFKGKPTIINSNEQAIKFYDTLTVFKRLGEIHGNRLLNNIDTNDYSQGQSYAKELGFQFGFLYYRAEIADDGLTIIKLDFDLHPQSHYYAGTFFPPFNEIYNTLISSQSNNFINGFLSENLFSLYSEKGKSFYKNIIGDPEITTDDEHVIFTDSYLMSR